ncbi:helix-turn-helix domain-containing protein [Micromonospora globbae]|uniref:helix-turn-helix domain-containing protein n=1 Tax=Micromonospora globbae TaxID=1894969 RepID=UPI003421C8CD
MGDAKRPSEVLAEQVREWRRRRDNMSAQGLANRIAEMGGTLSRVAISKIENGDRGVSVDEWLQLAHALAVPPPLLFLDLESGTDVEVAPGVVLHPWLVWEWATGQHPPLVPAAEGGAYVTRVEEFARAQTAINLYRSEARAATAINNAESAIRGAEYVDDADQLRAARTAHVDALRELARVLDLMIEHGMTPPGKPARWVEAIRSLGLSKHPDRLVVHEVGDGGR